MKLVWIGHSLVNPEEVSSIRDEETGKARILMKNGEKFKAKTTVEGAATLLGIEISDYRPKVKPEPKVVPDDKKRTADLSGGSGKAPAASTGVGSQRL